MSSFNWTLSVKNDAGEEIHHEDDESWPENLGLSKVKTGFVYEYKDDSEYVGNIYQYYNGFAEYDISALSGISASQIKSAKLVGLSLLSHDVDSLAASSTLNHVEGEGSTEICGVSEITGEIDLLPYIISDANAGRSATKISFSAPDVPVGTTGKNYAQVAMLINQDSSTPSYISIIYAAVPEPSAYAAIFGAFAVAFALMRRRVRK